MKYQTKEEIYAKYVCNPTTGDRSFTKSAILRAMEEYKEQEVKKNLSLNLPVIKSVCSIGKSYSDCEFHSDNVNGCEGCNHYEQTVL